MLFSLSEWRSGCLARTQGAGCAVRCIAILKPTLHSLQRTALTPLLSLTHRHILFPLAYLFNIDTVRTTAHIVSVGVCVRVLAQLGFANL